MTTLLVWLDALDDLAPVVLGVIPGFPKVLIPVIVAAIAAAEKIGGSGIDKKASVIDAIGPMVSGKDVALVDEGIDKVVETVNIVTS